MLGVMVPDVEPMLASHGVPTWHRDSWVEPKVDGSFRLPICEAEDPT
ncbi:MAG: hypothetical protein KY395_08695 [Actinobacteria bacterium]|nr:hypothetical protein [Actinomycetota bacterium]